jgi:Right handed beta helix region
MNRWYLPSLSALLFAAAGCATPSAETLQVGPDAPYKMPSAAIAKAHDGDTIDIAPGEYFDCGFVRANNVVLQGTGPADKVVMTDKTCGGKAILVIDGHNVTVRNMTLTRARVPDGNGGGIRAEGGDLTIDNVRFINNQDGILSAPNPNATITIRNSDFELNGGCEKACAHGVYVGQIKLLHVENSRFFDTKQAHHIKSRAARTEVINTTIEDGPDGTASYLVEVPNGGDLVLRGSTLEKGPHAENHTAAVVIGDEGVTQPTHEIVVANNKFRLDGDYMTIFVRNLTATEAQLTNNTLTGGRIKALQGDGSVN